MKACVTGLCNEHCDSHTCKVCKGIDKGPLAQAEGRGLAQWQITKEA